MKYSFQQSAASAFLLALAIAAAPLTSLAASDAAACAFTTDLTIGSDTSSVKCLQQYLNANGYAVAATGVGSVGHETTQFKEKTLAAVKKWQIANGVTPATGTFGAKSRAKYKELTSATSTTPAPVPVPAPAPAPAPAPVPTPATADTQSERDARNLLKSVQKSLATVQDDYDTAHEDGDDTGKAKTYLEDARDTLMVAYAAFVNEKYDDAQASATEAKNTINDAADELGSSSSDSKDAANTAITNAKKTLQSAMDVIDAANAKGKNTNKADTYISDAQSSLSDARDAYKSKDYQDALDFVKDALSLISKAKSSVK